MPLFTHLPVRAVPFEPPSAKSFPPGDPICNSVRDAFVDHAIVVSPRPEPSLTIGLGSAVSVVPSTTLAGTAAGIGSGGGFEQAPDNKKPPSINVINTLPALIPRMSSSSSVYVILRLFFAGLAAPLGRAQVRSSVLG